MRRTATLLGLSLILGACGKREEVTATETRAVTMRDENLKLDATSDERFRQGRTAPEAAGDRPDSPVVAEVVPKGWVEAPPTTFRLINYRFGTEGEAYVLLSGGGVLDNVNRWFDQFGVDKLDVSGLAKLEPIKAAGFEGVWVSLDGDYNGGMGQEPRSNWGLRGVVAEGPQGILTVKMVGPSAEIAEAEDDLKGFVAGLKPAP